MWVLGSCGLPGEGLGLQGSPGVGRENQPSQPVDRTGSVGMGMAKAGRDISPGGSPGQEAGQGTAVAGLETASHGWGRTG